MGTFQDYMFEYFFSPQPVRCLQQHWYTPKDQNSQRWQLSVDELTLPQHSTLEPTTCFTLLNTHNTVPCKRQRRTTLLGSQAQDFERSLSSAGLEEQGHSHAAARDPPLHARSFKPLQVPQNPDGAGLQRVQTIVARLSSPPFTSYSQ